VARCRRKGIIKLEHVNATGFLLVPPPNEAYGRLAFFVRSSSSNNSEAAALNTDFSRHHGNILDAELH